MFSLSEVTSIEPLDPTSKEADGQLFCFRVAQPPLSAVLRCHTPEDCRQWVTQLNLKAEIWREKRQAEAVDVGVSPPALNNSARSHSSFSSERVGSSLGSIPSASAAIPSASAAPAATAGTPTNSGVGGGSSTPARSSQSARSSQPARSSRAALPQAGFFVAASAQSTPEAPRPSGHASSFRMEGHTIGGWTMTDSPSVSSIGSSPSAASLRTRGSMHAPADVDESSDVETEDNEVHEIS